MGWSGKSSINLEDAGVDRGRDRGVYLGLAVTMIWGTRAERPLSLGKKVVAGIDEALNLREKLKDGLCPPGTRLVGQVNKHSHLSSLRHS